VTYAVNDGYITRETTVNEEMSARPGSTRLYNGGFESDDDQEDVRVKSSRIVAYSETGEQSATKITADYDERGYTTRYEVEQLESYLPAAQKKSAVRPDPDLFPNGKVASRNEHQEIEVTASSECLEMHRPNWTDRVSDQYLETADEAEARARHLLAVGSAIPYSWTVAANPILSEAVLTDLLDRDGLHVQRVSIEPSGRGMITRVEALYHVV
jgi:hypothetical protein